MKVKVLVGLAGVDFALSPGDETDRFGDKEAIRLIEAGFAAPAVAQTVETADAKPVIERRAKRKE